ncbi:MAG: hypothetical protein IPJ69_00010 [Deltaproteobacteria bacterium]|nr:MAG: hypothetical protein IPJ69_00010 [Deltaproteobacteria bacterium]
MLCSYSLQAASKAALNTTHQAQDYGEVGVFTAPPRDAIFVDGQKSSKPAIIHQVQKTNLISFK